MNDVSSPASPEPSEQCEPLPPVERVRPAAQDGAAAQDSPYGVLIGALTAATFIVILNETTMSNAIAKLQDYFHISEHSAQWLTSAFMLTMAITIPLSGWIIDRFGPRGSLLAAMSTFIVGTTAAMLAPSFEILLVARVVQAMGTAIMIPLLMSTLMNVVPEHKRGGTMGYVSLAISVAPATGPVLSGAILEFLTWRWIFGIVLPLAVLVTVIAARLIPAGTGTASGAPDLLSVALSVLGFGSLVWGLSGIGEGGAAPLPAPVLIAVGLVSVALLVWRQLARKSAGREPLLDVSVFRGRDYSVGIALMTIGFGAFLGIMVILPLVLQHARDVSVLHTGLTIMPAGVAMGVLGPPVGRLYDRFGARKIVFPGSFVVVAGLALVAFLVPAAPWQLIAVVNLFLGAGLALVFTPMFTASLSAVPAPLYSHGSAILATMQQVGGAAGIAALVSVMAIGSTWGGGAPDPLAGGQLALYGAAALMVVVVVLAAFTPKRPGSEVGGAHGGHGH